MAKLNKTQTYAIQWLNHSGLDAENIATELNLNIKQVQSILEKNTEASKDTNNIKTKSSVVGDKKKNLMIMETSAKKNKSVAIMTREASQQGDNCPKTPAKPKNNSHIFRPKQ